MVWYSHLLKNFPQFVVIHTIKGFSIANYAEVDVFLESPCFIYHPNYVGNFISGNEIDLHVSFFFFTSGMSLLYVYGEGVTQC